MNATTERVTVTAVFDRLDGTEPFERPVELAYRDGWVHLYGGPTGYESAPAVILLGGTKDWYACVGTRGTWMRCVVRANDLAQAGLALGVRL